MVTGPHEVDFLNKYEKKIYKLRRKRMRNEEKKIPTGKAKSFKILKIVRALEFFVR